MMNLAAFRSSFCGGSQRLGSSSAVRLVKCKSVRPANSHHVNGVSCRMIGLVSGNRKVPTRSEVPSFRVASQLD